SMRKKLLLIISAMAFSMILKAQDIPTPSAYYNFNTDWFIDDNKTDKETATKLQDNSGNELDAVWFNYNSEFPSEYGGFQNEGGKWGAAAFLSGYKSVCDDTPEFPGGNSPASCRDLIVFAGNNNANGWDVIDTSSIWQGTRKAFTVAYWWKSERETTTKYTNACPPDQVPDWGEDETHFDGGAFNGIDIRCYFNYFKFGWRNGATGFDDGHETSYFIPAGGEAPAKGEWIHVAITFDGTTGDLTLFLNGTVAVDWEDESEANPNPIKTGYTQFDGVSSDASVVFGATNGASPSGRNLSGNFWGEATQHEGKFGYIAENYRLGWPARGVLDEFAYWHDVALTQTQIEAIVNSEISTLLDGTGITDYDYNKDLFNVFPNPSNGEFTLQVSSKITEDGVLTIMNMNGTTVYEQAVEAKSNQLKLNLSVAPGLYIVKYQAGTQTNVERLIVK
ncbi:MAG: T9SS type A sorting domain-containing protein, partial [Draconibacterium sp.]|nr:T9SS type A sorting domain-containing protein [Draconibacterium sp.]